MHQHRRPIGAMVMAGVLVLAGIVTVHHGGTRLDGVAADAGRSEREAEAPGSPITLALAGDVHFAGALNNVPRTPGSTLGPLSARLKAADLAVVNLETAITARTERAAKSLEDPSNRFWFKTYTAALGVLARSGVDVASIANNHAGDYGVAGLRDTIGIGAASPVRLIGAGLDDDAAFAPYRRTIRGTDVAVLAADASFREGAAAVWSVQPGTGPGIARDQTRLLAAVRDSAERDDVVVVYMHWGEEGNGCATAAQQALARQLSEAGADVVVGTHAHVPAGAGTLPPTDGAGEREGARSTYVSYGLGNFFWYHGYQAETGVLELTVQPTADGARVTSDAWTPGVIPIDGGAAQPLTGASGGTEVSLWRGLRGCTDLDAGPTATARAKAEGLEPFQALISPIDAALAARMKGRTHRAGCPVPLTDLRHLRITYLGFDDKSHVGDMVVNVDVVADVRQAFNALYAARFPIARMQLVDDFGGNDNASMAANNTSAYNCRRVAGTTGWSAHAYGRAVDINPVQNPYLLGGTVLPPAGSRYAAVNRYGATSPGRGVIRNDAVADRVFTRLGWVWGGDYAEPDYQHFALR